MKKMLAAVRSKLRSRAGETLGETLVGLLVGALALVMLAGAISTSTRLVLRSKAKIDEYNATIEKVVTQTAVEESDDPAADSDYVSGTGKVFLAGDNLNVEGVDIAYYQSNIIKGTPVIAYNRS